MTGPRFRQILGRIDMSAMGTETGLIHPRPLDLAFLTAVLLLGYARVLNSYFLADDTPGPSARGLGRWPSWPGVNQSLIHYYFGTKERQTLAVLVRMNQMLLKRQAESLA